jgi:hypothetical protein
MAHATGVILSQYSGASYAVQLFRNGTDGLGYLLKASIGNSTTCCTRCVK